MLFLKILSFGIFFLIGMLLLFCLILILSSFGKLKPAKTKNAIAQKLKLNINGAKQGMFIVGDDIDNPVLLFVHGGPGSPEYIVFHPDLKELEKDYTICYWDQRGAGMSYYFNLPDYTVDDLVEDTKEVAKYLIERFSKEKIFLLGHSWGSFLSVKTITKYPELFSAYIGIGQVSNQFESEKRLYDYFIKRSTELKNTKLVQFLTKFDANDARSVFKLSYIKKRYKLLLEYGIGFSHKKMDGMAGLKNILFFKGYTGFEKIKLFFGFYRSFKSLVESALLKDKLMQTHVSLDLPVYIIHGKFDYEVSYTLSKEYFELIQAPKKEFFTFEESAHWPLIEEKDRFIDIMKVIKTEGIKS